jgi:hypothetical protein
MDLEWKTEKRKIKDLKLFDGNPRKMTKEQAEQLLESLKKFNYVELIVVDQNNRVIAGNMRVQALKQLGREDEEIEVRVPNRPLTEEEAREYLLRSNKNVGEWDWDLLANFDKNLLQKVGFERWQLGILNEDVYQDLLPPMEDGEPEKLAYKTIKLYFDSKDSFNELKEFLKEKIKLTDKTDSIWYKKRPERKMKRNALKFKKKIKNRYPIFIISKGRWNKQLTAELFKKLDIDFYLVVEPKEYELYKQNYPDFNYIITPENFSERGQLSIPVRNFVWEKAIEMNSGRHWIVDDNISDLVYSTGRNHYYLSDNGSWFFRCMEDFVDLFENVALAGPNYTFFEVNQKKNFFLNTRVYSCILIKNDLQFRWRGKFNEDTDLSLNVLKTGYWVTVLFNKFLIKKVKTMVLKGGNTEEYKKTYLRYEFAYELFKNHPDVVKIVWRYNRWHHYIDYNIFQNPILKGENFKRDFFDFSLLELN